MPFHLLATDTTPFPTLSLDAQDIWEWPRPPFGWRHRPPPPNTAHQPCRIELPDGTVVQGEMSGFDPVARTLCLRTAPGRPELRLPLARLRRLTLTDPLTGEPPLPGAPPERVPVAAHERQYVLHPADDGAPPLRGLTVGRVATDAGLYLFSAVDEETDVQRVFVPRSAYARAEFGPTTREIAARDWCADADALRAALEARHRAPVRPIGASLLALALLTPEQLRRELARKPDDVPLGEALVAAGLITPADIVTAVAHKMGHPLVDLERFPIDPEAVHRLPRAQAERHRVLPLMLDRGSLVVAIDNPLRMGELRPLEVSARAPIVPVLAPAQQIVQVLRHQDLWRQGGDGAARAGRLIG